jgi:two-component system, NarL family, nitrate/nitrite response regulator NarL
VTSVREAPDVDVVIVEDHELLAQSLTFALRAEQLQAVIPDHLDPDAIVELVRASEPAVVLLDLDLGDHGSSLPLIDRCRQLGAHVVMVTAATDRARLAACIEAGAEGIVAKARPLEQLVAAVRQVLRTGTLLRAGERDEWLAELRTRRTDDARRLAPFDRLTERERQVLAALVEGRSADRIAEVSVVSVTTVRSQIKSILGKLGVNSQLEAVALARRSGWSDPRLG